MIRNLPILTLLLLAAAGPPSKDADWPCVQRLVPTVTAGTFWAGPQPTGDWRGNPQVAALVAEVAPRSVPREAGVSRLEAFAADLPPPDRRELLPLVFAGLVDETNAERTQIIERLHAIARRQRGLTDVVGRVTAELRGLPADAPEAKREEVADRRAFLIRDYESVERTIRYACETPVQLDARLGAFARALQGASGG